MKIKPINNRVLVESIKEEKSKSGIILPDTINDKKQTEGVIVAVSEKSIFKIGTRIIFTEYSFTKIKQKDILYLVIDENDILAIIEDDKVDSKGSKK